MISRLTAAAAMTAVAVPVALGMPTASAVGGEGIEAPAMSSRHCVGDLDGGEAACFTSAAEVAAWKAARPGWRVLVVFFDGGNFLGAKKELGGYHPCTASKLDTDYANAVMPFGWDNRVSSFVTMNGCDLLGYRQSYYAGGRFAGYLDRQAAMGTWSDAISSFKLS